MLRFRKWLQFYVLKLIKWWKLKRSVKSFAIIEIRVGVSEFKIQESESESVTFKMLESESKFLCTDSAAMIAVSCLLPSHRTYAARGITATTQLIVTSKILQLPTNITFLFALQLLHLHGVVQIHAYYVIYIIIILRLLVVVHAATVTDILCMFILSSSFFFNFSLMCWAIRLLKHIMHIYYSYRLPYSFLTSYRELSCSCWISQVMDFFHCLHMVANK